MELDDPDGDKHPDDQAGSPTSRLVLSCRASRLTMSRGVTFDFEDVVAHADPDVAIAAASVPTDAIARLGWRAAHAAPLWIDRRPAGDGHEFVFAMAQSPTDLADHLVHRSEIRAATVSAAYIEELWVKNIPLQTDIRRFLAEFDHVFVGCEATVEPLADHIGVPCSYLPPSMDLDVFSAAPWPPPAIDVYAMGRRQPQLHAALLEWAGDDAARFYLYDTFAGNPPIHDHREHRRHLADLIRRSRYFLVNAAKVDRPGETEGQAEVGYRFFEGAAAGAVMIGTPNDAPAFNRLFPWDEPAVAIDPSGSDLAERLAELDADPERTASIRRQNAAGSLKLHDCVHRWRDVLAAVGLEAPPEVAHRIDRLGARADQLDPSITARIAS